MCQIQRPRIPPDVAIDLARRQAKIAESRWHRAPGMFDGEKPAGLSLAEQDGIGIMVGQ